MRPLPSAFPKAEALFLRGKYHHYHVRMFERALCEYEICEDRFRTPPALRAFPRNHRRIFTKMYAKLLQKCGYIRKQSLFSKTALLLS